MTAGDFDGDGDADLATANTTVNTVGVLLSDTTPPETKLDSSGPTGAVTDTTARFAFSSEDGARFECSLDNKAYTACASPRVLTGLTPGGHNFRVRAVDAAGNTDPSPAGRSWTILANTAPVVSAMTPGANAVVRDPTPLIGARITDKETNLQKSNVRLFVDGRPKTAFRYSPTTDRLSYASPALKPGRHAVKVVATDAAGKATTKAWNFTLKKSRR